MNEKEKRLLLFAVEYLEIKLGQSYELHPKVQRAAGASDSIEIHKLIDSLKVKLSS
jgi:hypothetical protein